MSALVTMPTASQACSMYSNWSYGVPVAVIKSEYEYALLGFSCRRPRTAITRCCVLPSCFGMAITSAMCATGVDVMGPTVVEAPPFGQLGSAFSVKVSLNKPDRLLTNLGVQPNPQFLSQTAILQPTRPASRDPSCTNFLLVVPLVAC